jgi:hypothetical protein
MLSTEAGGNCIADRTSRSAKGLRSVGLPLEGMDKCSSQKVPGWARPMLSDDNWKELELNYRALQDLLWDWSQ